MSLLTDNQDTGAHSDSYATTINKARVLSDNGDHSFQSDEKFHYAKADVEVGLEATSNPHVGDASDTVLHTEREIATHIISVDDDPSLNPWTFRAFFLGLGLSAFGGSLGMSIFCLSLSSVLYINQPRSITSNR